MSMAKLEALNQNFDTAHNYCTAILKHAPELDEPVLVLNIIKENFMIIDNIPKLL